jgi:hypothetical protein
VEMSEIGRVKVITFNITVFILILLIGVIIISIYLVFPQYRTEIKFITLVIGGLSGIYSAYYVGVSIRSNVEINKKNNSMELIKQYVDKNSNFVRSFVARVCNYREIPYDEIIKSINNDDDTKSSVHSVLNYFEGISIAIQEECVNERILNEALRDSIRRCYLILSPYIEFLRKEYNSKDIYKELEKLHSHWCSEKRLAKK